MEQVLALKALPGADRAPLGLRSVFGSWRHGHDGREPRLMPHPRKLASLMFLPAVVPAVAVGALLAGAPSAASANALESRDGRQECRHVPQCLTVKTSVQNLQAGKPVTREFTCPAGTYFWNWSATVAQFVQVILQDTRLDNKKHEVAATFQYYAQTGNGPGRAQIYLGCSPKPISSGKLQQRRLGYGWNPAQRL